ncbi:MAG TPA: MarR family transcriptional regulator [Burkholderiales bacterium]|nr:MarR family transcriptional regulator [Burkholderiales bacterium]
MGPIYDKKTFKPREAVGALIGLARKTMINRIDAELAPFDVSAAQWLVVLLVGENAVASASGLCDTLAYDPGAMTRLLDRLERKGIVRRVRSPEDRRTIQLELTQAGKALYPKIIAAIADVNNSLLRGFSRSEVGQLEDFLRRMLANA